MTTGAEGHKQFPNDPIQMGGGGAPSKGCIQKDWERLTLCLAAENMGVEEELLGVLVI